MAHNSENPFGRACKPKERCCGSRRVDLLVEFLCSRNSSQVGDGSSEGENTQNKGLKRTCSYADSNCSICVASELIPNKHREERQSNLEKCGLDTVVHPSAKNKKWVRHFCFYEFRYRLID